MFELLTLAAAQIELPDTLHFLNGGWWVLHLVAIPTVFLIGMAIGRRGGRTWPATTREEQVGARPGMAG
jgi:hypothetical protein